LGRPKGQAASGGMVWGIPGIEVPGVPLFYLIGKAMHNGRLCKLYGIEDGAVYS